MKINNLRYSLAIIGLAIPLVLSGCNDKSNQQSVLETTDLELEQDETKETLRLKEMSDKYEGVYYLDFNGIHQREFIDLTKEYIQSETEFVEVLDEIENLRKSKRDCALKLYKPVIKLDININEYSNETSERFNKFLINLHDIDSLLLSDTGLEDISFLANVPKIESLFLDNNAIKDITIISDITSLENLFLKNNNITDITPLENLYNLKILFLEDNNITNIDSLSNLFLLEELFLDNNNITDITPLENLTSLKILMLSDNNINNVDSLKNMSSLRCLSLNCNNITDVKTLQGLQSLEHLSLWENNISDIQPLVYLIKNNENIDIYTDYNIQKELDSYIIENGNLDNDSEKQLIIK